MKIQLLSDLHFEFRELPANAFKTDAEVLVLAGDITCGRTKLELKLIEFAQEYKYIVYVPGNHEYYGHSINELSGRLDVPNNVFVLNPGTVVINNVAFIGATLWTDFHGDDDAANAARFGINDFRVIRHFTIEDCIERNTNETNYIKHWLSDFSPDMKKVVVTHFLPAMRCVHPRWVAGPSSMLNKYFANNLDSYIETLENTTWMFGHTHDKISTVIGNTLLVSNPRGYPSEYNEFDPNFTITV